METDVLLFEVEERRLGVPAALVTEVLRAVTPLPLPRAPASVMGMINLRGHVVPVLNTRVLLNLTPAEVRHTDHFVILRDDELTYAIHVDRAIDLSRLQTDSAAVGKDIVATGPVSIGMVTDSAMGFVQVINPACLLSDQDRAAILSILSSVTTRKITI